MKKRLKRVLLKDALDRYYESVSKFKKGRLQEFYRISTIKRSWLANKVMADICTVDVAQYRDERLSAKNQKTGKPLSTNTVRLELALLSSLFNIAKVEWRYCNENPVEVLRKPKPSAGRTRRLSKREEIRISRYFLNKGNTEAYHIFHLALETAMRQGEILSITWRDVSLSGKYITLHQTKNGDSRTVPLSQRAVSILSERKHSCDLNQERVFSYTANGLKSAWRLAILELNIEDLHFHDLRHEAISRLVELGTLNLIEISSISGHRSMAMLKRYSHMDSKQLVRKLNKKTREKRNLFPPYPAIKTETASSIIVDFFDLDFSVEIHNKSDWQKEAEQHLIIALWLRYALGKTPEQPSTLTEGGSAICLGDTG